MRRHLTRRSGFFIYIGVLNSCGQSVCNFYQIVSIVRSDRSGLARLLPLHRLVHRHLHFLAWCAFVLYLCSVYLCSIYLSCMYLCAIACCSLSVSKTFFTPCCFSDCPSRTELTDISHISSNQSDAMFI